MKRLIYIIPNSRSNNTLRLAGEELTRWLSAACSTAEFGCTNKLERAHFVLGTFEDLSELLGQELDNDPWIDEIVVRSVNGRLILAGSNPRSVLFAVYTYLDSLGFAWTMPGPDGEVIPRLEHIPLDHYDIYHKASLMYRGFGLAGAYDVHQGQEFVAWMARNRFNYLFIEGNTAQPAYQQALGRKVPMQEARRYDRQIIRAAKMRGLTFEHVGHGWTAWTLGFPPGSPRRKEYRLSDEMREMAAELNGVRGIYQNSPGNTHLCLSHPQSQQRMAKLVCHYAQGHPDVDVLAIWMADGFNNWCECSACSQVHPCDLWVQLINRIAREAYEVRPSLKLEVLGYSVLMEPPPTQKIDNSRGNLIFMYAPFIRCYLHSLDDSNCVSDQPPHKFPPANQWHYPMNWEYFQYFEGWREQFSGTNYVFDYYCWLPIKRDIFEGNVPETICRDMKSYPAHGINGCIDCSRAQSFWPTPMARWMQARASWDASVDYELERRRLLELVYGEHAGTVDEYLAMTYQHLLPHHHGREEERGFSEDQVRNYKHALPAIRGALGAAVDNSGGVRKKFLQRVAVHADFTQLHLDCLLAEAVGDFDRAAELAIDMHTLATRHSIVLAGAADPPEINWLKEDTLERLQAKREGTFVREG